MDSVTIVLLACFYFPMVKTENDYHTLQLQSYYFQSSSLTFGSASYSGPCVTSKDCRPFGYICKNNNTCDCDSMYVLDFSKTQCVGGVGQKCVYDEHCIQGAFCMNQAICKCKDTTPVVLEGGMVCGRSNRMETMDKMRWVLMYFIITFL